MKFAPLIAVTLLLAAAPSLDARPIPDAQELRDHVSDCLTTFGPPDESVQQRVQKLVGHAVCLTRI
ncbi:MAG: hypothetical protein ACPGQL_09335 [Thermoplasmatota archaeon]